ncbi:MAG: hypothetical protein J2P17_09400, partial [Mycobacterium sp.]|nr:hypothetical protein [Mycobacterium sp.]
MLGLVGAVDRGAGGNRPVDLQAAIVAQLAEEPSAAGARDPLAHVIAEVENPTSGVDTAVVLVDDGTNMHAYLVTDDGAGTAVIFDTNSPETAEDVGGNRIPRVRTMEDWHQSFRGAMVTAHVARLRTTATGNLVPARGWDFDSALPRANGLIRGPPLQRWMKTSNAMSNLKGILAAVSPPLSGVGARWRAAKNEESSLWQAAFANPALGLLLLSSFITGIGNALMEALEPAFALLHYGALAGAVNMVGNELPYMLFAMFSGIVTDVVQNFRRTLLISQIVGFISSLYAAAAVAMGAPHLAEIIPATSAVESAADAFFLTSAGKALIELAGPTRQIGLSRIQSSQQNTLRIAGAGVGILLGIQYPELGFDIQAATFLLAILLLARMPRIDIAAAEVAGGVRSIIRDFMGGFRTLQKHPLLREMSSNQALWNFLDGLQSQHITSIVVHPGIPGWARAASALLVPIGAVAGSWAPRKWLGRFSISTLSSGAVVGAAVPAIVAAASGNPWVVEGAMGAGMFLIGAAGTASGAIRNRVVPNVVRGRVYGFTTAVYRLSYMGAGMVGGAVLSYLGMAPAGWMLATAGVSLAAASAIPRWRNRLHISKNSWQRNPELANAITSTATALVAAGLDVDPDKKADSRDRFVPGPEKGLENWQRLRNALDIQRLEIRSGKGALGPDATVSRVLAVLESGDNKAEGATLFIRDGPRLHALTFRNIDGETFVHDGAASDRGTPGRGVPISEWQEPWGKVDRAFVGYFQSVVVTDDDGRQTGVKLVACEPGFDVEDEDQGRPRRPLGVTGRDLREDRELGYSITSMAAFLSAAGLPLQVSPKSARKNWRRLRKILAAGIVEVPELAGTVVDYANPLGPVVEVVRRSANEVDGAAIFVRDGAGLWHTHAIVNIDGDIFILGDTGDFQRLHPIGTWQPPYARLAEVHVAYLSTDDEGGFTVAEAGAAGSARRRPTVSEFAARESPRGGAAGTARRNGDPVSSGTGEGKIELDTAGFMGDPLLADAWWKRVTDGPATESVRHEVTLAEKLWGWLHGGGFADSVDNVRDSWRRVRGTGLWHPNPTATRYDSHPDNRWRAEVRRLRNLEKEVFDEAVPQILSHIAGDGRTATPVGDDAAIIHDAKGIPQAVVVLTRRGHTGDPMDALRWGPERQQVLAMAQQAVDDALTRPEIADALKSSVPLQVWALRCYTMGVEAYQVATRPVSASENVLTVDYPTSPLAEPYTRRKSGLVLPGEDSPIDPDLKSLRLESDSGGGGPGLAGAGRRRLWLPGDGDPGSDRGTNFFSSLAKYAFPWSGPASDGGRPGFLWTRVGWGSDSFKLQLADVLTNIGNVMMDYAVPLFIVGLSGPVVGGLI